jgi:hypothetical protein
MAKRSYEEEIHDCSENDDVEEQAKWSRGGTATKLSPKEPLMICCEPPTCHVKPRSFYTIDSLERHLSKHATRCPICFLPFPNANFQNLHVEEHHDSVFEARKARGEPVFRCFVETCKETFPSATQRRRHLMKEHAYPEMFRFNIVSKGLKSSIPSLLYPERPGAIDTGKSLKPKHKHGQHQASKPPIMQNRAKREQEPSATDMQAQAIDNLFKEAMPLVEDDVPMTDLTSALSETTLMVPRKIHFGRH